MTFGDLIIRDFYQNIRWFNYQRFLLDHSVIKECVSYCGKKCRRRHENFWKYFQLMAVCLRTEILQYYLKFCIIMKYLNISCIIIISYQLFIMNYHSSDCKILECNYYHIYKVKINYKELWIYYSWLLVLQSMPPFFTKFQVLNFQGAESFAWDQLSPLSSIDNLVNRPFLISIKFEAKKGKCFYIFIFYQTRL